MTVKVYFGGSYTENWSADFKLTVTYSDRPFVEAEMDKDQWRAVGGDKALCALLRSDTCPSLTQEYFQSAAEVTYIMARYAQPGRSFGSLHRDICRCVNRLTEPELFRALLDEKGLPIDEAVELAAMACFDGCTGEKIDCVPLAACQPRTAALVKLLQEGKSKLLLTDFDAANPENRSPSGALRCGETLRLAFRILFGKVSGASLIIISDQGTSSLPMTVDGGSFCAELVENEPAALWYYFRLDTEAGLRYILPDENGHTGIVRSAPGEGFRLTVYRREFDTPAWFRGSVMYQIFPDRFAKKGDSFRRGIEYHRALGQTPQAHASFSEPVKYLPREGEKDYSPDDFYGGSFQGVESRLPYLKDLGVTCIYFNPIVEARSNHRYDTSDYLRPDPILGTGEDFEQLCRSAELLGIRIILDGVFSHTGADSVYFNRFGHYPGQGACQGESSPYYKWYSFSSFPKEYKCWWGFKDLPEVDEQKESWRDFVISGENSVVKTWLRRGAGGWRLDVADELPDTTLELIRTAVKAEKPDAPIIGEVWEDAVTKVSYGARRKYALGGALDSVMNYPFRAAVLSFARRASDAFALENFLLSQCMNYPQPLYYSLMNLLGSHDVERLITALAAKQPVKELSRQLQHELSYDARELSRAAALERMCAVLQFSLPGVPSIYYGDEQGMVGGCDPFNRAPFTRGDGELCAFYAALASIRNNNPSLSVGKVRFQAWSGDVLLVLRYIDGSDAFGKPSRSGAFLCALNRSEAAVRVRANCAPLSRDDFEAELKPLSGTIFDLSTGTALL